MSFRNAGPVPTSRRTLRTIDAARVANANFAPVRYPTIAPFGQEIPKRIPVRDYTHGDVKLTYVTNYLGRRSLELFVNEGGEWVTKHTWTIQQGDAQLIIQSHIPDVEGDTVLNLQKVLEHMSDQPLDTRTDMIGLEIKAVADFLLETIYQDE